MDDPADLPSHESVAAERLYGEARRLRPNERAAYVEAVCAGNPELRAEVLSLLEHGDAGEAFIGLLRHRILSNPSWMGAAAADHAARSPGPTELPAGATVGRYRIVERIGAGGMGAVYRAHDPSLDRDVALKLLPPHLAADPGARERFLLEARAAASLDDPHICTIHEVGEAEDGRLFLAMARYEGETLKERIARGRFSVEEAVEIAVQIARGLAAAHERGIVHRDVKPGNIMLLPDGTVKLLDFGLAKVSDVTLTRSGTTPGTVAYMSPEQVRADDVDHRTDLWSLGVVLCEMLAGRRPFRGDSHAAVLQAVLHRQPEALRKRRPDVPARLAEIVERLLAKRSTERLPSAERLLAELESSLGEGAPDTEYPRRGPALALFLRRPRILAVVAAVVAAAGLFVVGVPSLSVGTRESVEALHPEATPFVAVLPFDNLSAEPENEYFSEGISQDILLHLARLDELRVVGPISAARFRSGDRSVQEVAEELGVDAVLKGSVQMDGNRVRIAAQLLDARSGEPRWAESYDRHLADIFQVQTEVARSVAMSLLTTLSSADRRRLEATSTEDVDAYNLYLMGRHLADRRHMASLEAALGYFVRAIEADPENARAHAGIADVYSQLVTWGALPPDSGFAATRAAAQRALELDPSLADAWVSLGYLHFWHEWDWEEAERAFRRAIVLNPGYSTGHHWYSLLLVTLGRLEEAEAAIGRAAELDPLSRIIRTIQGRLYWLSGRSDRALEEHRVALELDPGYPVGHMWLALVHLTRDETEEAVRHLRRGWELDPEGPVLRAGLALSHAVLDEEERALEILQDLRRGWGDRTPVPFWDAVVRARLGWTGQAFESLQGAVRHRDGWLTELKVTPLLDPLRDDPRYEELLRQMNLD